MDIKKITIKNINKKIIAATMAFSLVTCAVTGYIAANNKNTEKTKYEKITGVAGFGLLKNCYFIGVKNPEGNENFYIAEKVASSNSDFYLYLDLISGENVYINKEAFGFNKAANQILTRAVRIEDYLYDFEMVKKIYSEEDINELLQRMQQLDVRQITKK